MPQTPFPQAGTPSSIPIMQRNDVIQKLGQAAPGIRSAPGTTVSPAALRAFDAAAEGQRGDHDLNPGMHPDRALTAAAVLVPLIDRPDGMTVLLTKRTDHLHDHAGQVSFPGGRIDPEDRDAAAAALREAKEEVGLDPDRVD
ncbi:MAG: NUDIX domain-containing protein, partial [Dongia sp.]